MAAVTGGGLVKQSVVRRRDQVRQLQSLAEQFRLPQAQIDREIFDFGVELWLRARRAAAAAVHVN